MTDRRFDGAVLAFGAYTLLSFGDALVKSVGGKVPVFEIGFFTTGTALILVVLLKPRRQSWRDALRMKRPAAVLARAVAGLSASLLGIIAFTRLPLSEAYSLMFLAPLFAALLAAMTLKERIPPKGWLAIALGLLGVLLVVRPGFRVIVPAHGAALGVAISAAFGIILMRTIAAQESRTAILLVLMTIAWLSYAVACLVSGQVSLPALPQLIRLVGAGICGALGQILLLRATASAPASRIAPVQYCQLLWATLFGAIIFREQLDPLKIGGLILIGTAGLLIIGRMPQAAPRAPAR